MTFPRKSVPVKIGPWPKGINNVEHPEGLDPHELVDSVNFLHDETTSHLRPGYVKRLTGTSMSGLFGLDSSRALVFDNGSFLLVDTNSWTTQTLATEFPGNKWSFERIGPRVFFSNPQGSGRLHVPSLSVLPLFGTPNPAPSLALAALGHGSLNPGFYRAGFTQVDDWGEESGCTGLVGVNLTAQGGISVSLPTILPFDWRLYLSEPNGQKDELFLVDEFPNTLTQVDITLPNKGMQLETLYLKEVPLAALITLYNGRLYFAVDNLVYCTPSLRYGLYHPRMGLVGEFPEKVTVLERGTGCLFVVADRTYAYVGAGPEDFSLRYNVFNHPGVFGSGQQIEGNLFKGEGMPAFPETVPYWFTPRGAVVGLPGGSVWALSKGKAEPDRYALGASGVIEQHGFVHIVTALEEQTGPRDSLSLSEQVEVRVIKHGV